ncbi:MAG: hypothetical protein KAX49_19655 [Halanaerobiales bacterium]|nr:hypothetical protein [Halanaerobiales bacterium]
MQVQRFRDLTLISINEEQILVVACDSSGGIGSKEKDIIKVSPEIVGYFTTFVALAEVLSVGAKPMVVTNTLSTEMNDTGNKIIEGIKKVIEPLENEIILTGSTEENFSVCQTGMGITVIGTMFSEDWRRIRTKSGSIAVVVGLPKVGDEIKMGDLEILSISVLLDMRDNSFVEEILPVGSKGILYEAQEMARTNNLTFTLDAETSIPLYKSAGPATCAIISLKPESYDQFKIQLSLPVQKIGKFK